MKRNLHRLCLGIISLMVVQTAVAGQSGSGIVIQIVEANAGQNKIAEELPPIKVRVMDRTGRVIPGASVLFAVPQEGATGQFLPNASQVTVTTDTQGMAAAPRFRTNSVEGDYQTQIIASYRDSASRVVIPQSNVLKKKSSNKKIIILSTIIGGAAAAILAGTRGDAGAASPALNALAAAPTVTVGESVGVAPAPALIVVGGATSASSPGGTSTSTTTTSTPTSATVSPTVPSVPPVTQPPPSISSVCASMPPTSNRRDCR